MKRIRRTIIVMASAVALAMLSASCRMLVDSHSMKADMMNGYVTGQNQVAMAELDKRLDKPGFFNRSMVKTGDELAWRLESGMVQFLGGNSEASIAQLAAAEALIEDYDGRAKLNARAAISEGAAVAVNSTTLPYTGTGRDRIMIPVVKALAYLAKGDEEGFRVELFRLREAQEKALEANERLIKKENTSLEEAQKRNSEALGSVNQDSMFANSQNAEITASLAATKELARSGYGNCLNPLAVFLSAYGYAREDDWENAFVDYERLYKIMPSHPLVRAYYVTALRRTGRTVPAALASEANLPFTPSHNTLLFIFANGRGATMQQKSLYLPVIIPRHSSMVAAAWPMCLYFAAPYRHVRASVDGKTVETVSFASMDAIMAQEYTQRLPIILTRLIINVAAKEIAYQVALNEARQQKNDLAILAVQAGGTAYKLATNTADTRCWETLPKEYQLIELPMPQNRNITVTTDGLNAMNVSIPGNAQSAIIYVNAPSAVPAAVTARVFTLSK